MHSHKETILAKYSKSIGIKFSCHVHSFSWLSRTQEESAKSVKRQVSVIGHVLSTKSLWAEGGPFTVLVVGMLYV